MGMSEDHEHWSRVQYLQTTHVLLLELTDRGPSPTSQGPHFPRTSLRMSSNRVAFAECFTTIYHDNSTLEHCCFT